MVKHYSLPILTRVALSEYGRLRRKSLYVMPRIMDEYLKTLLDDIEESEQVRLRRKDVDRILKRRPLSRYGDYTRENVIMMAYLTGIVQGVDDPISNAIRKRRLVLCMVECGLSDRSRGYVERGDIYPELKHMFISTQNQMTGARTDYEFARLLVDSIKARKGR